MFSRSVRSPNAVASRSLPSRPPSCWLCSLSRLLFSLLKINQKVEMTHTSSRWDTIILQIPNGYVGAEPER